MSFRFLNTLLFTGSALALTSSIAAQNEPATPAQTSEIVVTATKIQSKASQLGLTLDILEGGPLNRLDSAEEITQYLSGVQAAVANGTQVVFQIRGIGAVDHQALTPTAAAVYMDGVYQATNVQTGPLLFDLERTEVLKGPQGSLYGRNASAGAINFISAKPTDETEGYAAIEIGNFERFNLNAATNLIVNEDISLRLAGRYLSQGPTLENVVTVPGIEAPAEAGGERDEFGLRAIGRYAPSDSTEVLLNVHYAEDNGVNPGPRNEGLELDRHEISVGPDGVDDTDNEFYGANVQVAHTTGDINFFSLTAVTGYNQEYGFSFGGLQDFSAAVPSLSGTANLDYTRDLTQFSQEFRLSRDVGSHKNLLGLYLEAEDFDQDYLVSCGELNRESLIGSCNYIVAAPRRGSNPASQAAANTLQSLIEQERKTAAIFTYNQFEFNPVLELVYGGRITFEKIEASGVGQHVFRDGVIGINNRNDRGSAIGDNAIKDTQFSGNIGLNFTPSDNLLFYTSISNGYKSGGFNGEVIDNADHFSKAGLFGPETINSYEIGAKFNRPKIRANIAAFYNDYKDPQARFFQAVTLDDGQVVNLNALTNFDKARSFGVEGGFQYYPFKGFEIGSSATWLDSEINDPLQASIDGDALPFASKFSTAVNLAYRWTLAERIEARLSANGKYQSKFLLGANLTSGGENFTQSGYETLDARFDVLFGSELEFGLWGRNLSNSDYATSAFSFFGPTTFRSNPRQYGVSVKYNF